MVSPRAPAAVGHNDSGLLVRLRELHSAMLAAVLADEGLAGVAELAAHAVGGPVLVVIPQLPVPAALASNGQRASTDAAALERWAAERVGGRRAAVPRDVIVEVPISFRGEVVGIAALLQAGEPPGAEASEFLHLAASVALTELAIDNAKQEVERSLRDSFLEELRSCRQLDGPELVRRAARLGCDLSRGAVILCAELISERPHLVAATIAEEHPGALAQRLDGIADRERSRVYAVLPAGDADASPAATLAAAKRLAARLQRYAIVGLSSFRADPATLGSAVDEAELVVDILQKSGESITDEIGSETYKLLLRMLASHPEEVQTFYEATIAPMVRYDDQHRTELVRTAQAYLDANCNMNATAGAIFAHRHTIAYRLDRVRELTGLDPMLSEDRERLGLGLKVYRIIASRLPR